MNMKLKHLLATVIGAVVILFLSTKVSWANITLLASIAAAAYVGWNYRADLISYIKGLFKKDPPASPPLTLVPKDPQ